MHELSLAQAVVAIATEHAAGRRVVKVELKVGHLRQVVPDALDFAFELVAEGTPVEGAELVMEEGTASGRCEACGAESTLAAFPAACPACGSLKVDVTGGDELLVDALELEEDELVGSGG